MTDLTVPQHLIDEAKFLVAQIYRAGYEAGYEAGKTGKCSPIWCAGCGLPVSPLRVSRRMNTCSWRCQTRKNTNHNRKFRASR